MNETAALTLVSPTGRLHATVLPLGARLQSLCARTSKGTVELVRGLQTPAQWQNDPSYAGAAIGRVSGRIARSQIDDAGTVYELPANDGRHHLHGGPGALHAHCWAVSATSTHRVALTTLDSAGTNGYPGTLRVRLELELGDRSLDVRLSAQTDARTPVALTYHPYFHLGGVEATDCREHWLQIAGHSILELDDERIPTGRVRIVQTDDPFDFRHFRRIRDAAGHADEQLDRAKGHDHTFILDDAREFDARLHHPNTGITLTVRSNQPALQLYTGQWLPPREAPLHGPLAGLCLEPQGFPDAVHHCHFPSPWLDPGTTYTNHIRYELDFT